VSAESTISILSTAGLTPSQLAAIQHVSARVHVVQVAPTPQAMQPCLSEAEVLLSHFRQTGFDPALAPRLRWIHLTSASVDQLLGQPIIEAQVVFTNCSGIHAVPIAEYVLASMLAFARHFPELFAQQQQRHWAAPGEVYAGLAGRELRGETLGIIGYGSIGREVARLARCFGMRVLAYKRDPAERSDPGWYLAGTGDPSGAIPAAWFGPGGLHDLLTQADYVVLSCPLTPETENLIDEEALRAMRSHAYLVNVGRGRLVDEEALTRALREGWIGGAGLDVARDEPLPVESELFDLPNVILSPHCSGTTAMYNERVVDVFCANLAHYLAGERLLNVIDRSKGY